MYAPSARLVAPLVGAFVALDLLLFYTFWELTLVPVCLIIGMWGDTQRLHAALKLVLYTMAGSVLMLVAILWTRAVPVAPERVDLSGRQGLELAEQLPEGLQQELAWGSRMLLTATPAASLLLHWQGRTLLRRGATASVA